MTLPHLENAVVPPEKLTKYLLSMTHEDGAGKAAFFSVSASARAPGPNSHKPC